MYCKSCGASLPENVRFCSSCGTATGFSGQPVPAVRSPLTRPREGRQIAGVCAGFARSYGWDILLIRILMVVGGIFIFPVPEVAYIVAWLAMPEDPLSLPSTTSVPPGNVSPSS